MKVYELSSVSSRKCDLEYSKSAIRFQANVFAATFIRSDVNLSSSVGNIIQTYEYFDYMFVILISLNLDR